MNNEEQKIKDLEKKIKKLEKVVDVQRKLIEVLKTLPGNKSVKLKSEKKGKKKNAVTRKTQGTSGSVANDGGVWPSNNSGTSAEAHTKNTQVMES